MILFSELLCFFFKKSFHFYKKTLFDTNLQQPKYTFHFSQLKKKTNLTAAFKRKYVKFIYFLTLLKNAYRNQRIVLSLANSLHTIVHCHSCSTYAGSLIDITFKGGSLK